MAEGKLLRSLLNSKINKMLSSEKDATTVNLKRAKIIKRMADSAGIETNTVSKILSGAISDPPIERLRAFSNVLDTEVSTLDNARNDKPKRGDHG